jgi:hypothetical protein
VASATLVLSGCGGRELTFSGDAAVPAADAAPPPAADAAPPPAADAAPPLSPLVADLLWQRSLSYYPVTQGHFFLGVSPDGGRVAVAFDLAALGGYQELATADGAPLTTLTGYGPWSRDRAWRRELRRAQVVDLATQAVLLDGTSALEMAGDGRHVFSFGCPDAATPGVPTGTIVRTDVDTGATVKVGDGLTGSCGYTPDVSAAVTAGGDRALFARGTSGVVTLSDVTSGTLSSWQAHAPPPSASTDPRILYTTSAILSIALAPDDARVATIGADGALRVWSFPDVVQLLPDIPVRWTNAFTSCYCQPRSFAPVAWSPDGALLATPDDGGRAVVRRASDGRILATLPAPDLTGSWSVPDDRGPLLLAFAPDGTALAALFDHVIAYYRLAAR